MERLLGELMPYLGRICGAIALDRGDDALQDTMMAILTHIGDLREPAAVRGWARRIAVREAVRHAKGDRSEATDPAAFELDVAAMDFATDTDVRAVLAGLPVEARTVLVLRHLEGLTEVETAALLSIKVGTVKSRTSRARSTFRARWTS